MPSEGSPLTNNLDNGHAAAINIMQSAAIKPDRSQAVTANLSSLIYDNFS